MSHVPRVTVVGSLNVDHTLRVGRIPQPGETLMATSTLTCFGGKGANQAIAAARAGAAVSLIGCLGDDDFGARYLAYLRDEGIGTDGICRRQLATGSALIVVDDQGENFIIVDPGANQALAATDIQAAVRSITGADVLLVQLETPLPVVKQACGIAAAAGVPVVLNPSPWTEAYRTAQIRADVLIVNEHETAQLTGEKCEQAIADPTAACRRAGCQWLIITRGAAPTLALSAAGSCLEAAPPPVQPVDTVGAGDTFAGAFAATWRASADPAEALAFANAAAALATLQPGAQAAIPRREQIVTLMAQPRPAPPQAPSE